MAGNRSAPGRDRRASGGGLLSTAIARLRRDPGLCVPFLLAGCCLWLVDWLRFHDPLPASADSGVGNGGISIQLEYVGYPTGVTRTTPSLESLVGLEPAYFLWGLGLYLLPLAAVSAAGAVTMARAMGREADLEGALSLFGYVLLVDFTLRLLGSIDALQALGLLGLVPIALLLFVSVRLFAVPGSLVAGRSILPALRETNHRTSGHGWRLFGAVLAIAISWWILGALPFGAFLSTVLVAPVHALAIVHVLEAEGVT